jgi:hypothetical protein
MGDHRAGGVLTGKVSFCPDRGPVRQAHVANAGPGRHQIAYRVRTVINNDELFIRIFLLEKTLNGARHKPPPIESWHDTGNQRQRVGRRHRLRTLNCLTTCSSPHSDCKQGFPDSQSVDVTKELAEADELDSAAKRGREPLHRVVVADALSAKNVVSAGLPGSRSVRNAVWNPFDTVQKRRIRWTQPTPVLHL